MGILKTKKRKGRIVYLARDVADDVVFTTCEMYIKKPALREGSYFGEGVETFCRKKFERITGYKLKPGECKRVRIKIEEA